MTLDKIAAGITVLMVVSYCAMSILYACDKQGMKSLYWFGAALLTFAVLRMK